MPLARCFLYLPSHHEETRPALLQEVMRAHPLGLLVTHGTSGLQANGIPFLLQPHADGAGLLRAHVARANPVWRELDASLEALVVFQGPHAYVSPNWYPSKAEHGKVVPTWNYIVVQARGRLSLHHDAGWLREHVAELTTRHEAARVARAAALPDASAFDRPWTLDDAPADFVNKLLSGIVGIELTVSSLQGKWKLSQNRSEADRTGVERGLDEQEDELSAGVALWMKRSRT